MRIQLADRHGRPIGPPIVTEADAYAAWVVHARDCPSCNPSSGRVCELGARLHGDWKAAEARQPVGRAS